MQKEKTNKFDSEDLYQYAEKCLSVTFDESVIKKPSFDPECICRGCDGEDITFDDRNNVVDESRLVEIEDKCMKSSEGGRSWNKVGEVYSDIVPYLRRLTQEQLDKGLATKK